MKCCQFDSQARPLCLKAIEDGNYSELADPRLENKYDQEEMARMVACASTSVRHSAKKRPKMSQVINNYNELISLNKLWCLDSLIYMYY